MTWTRREWSNLKALKRVFLQTKNLTNSLVKVKYKGSMTFKAIKRASSKTMSLTLRERQMVAAFIKGA